MFQYYVVGIYRTKLLQNGKTFKSSSGGTSFIIKHY